MSYEEALQKASREERFMATVYSINTLLIHKGIYTQQEFEQLFTEWVRKEENKKSCSLLRTLALLGTRHRPGDRLAPAAFGRLTAMDSDIALNAIAFALWRGRELLLSGHRQTSSLQIDCQILYQHRQMLYTYR